MAAKKIPVTCGCPVSRQSRLVFVTRVPVSSGCPVARKLRLTFVELTSALLQLQLALVGEPVAQVLPLLRFLQRGFTFGAQLFSLFLEGLAISNRGLLIIQSMRSVLALAFALGDTLFPRSHKVLPLRRSPISRIQLLFASGKIAVAHLEIDLALIRRVLQFLATAASGPHPSILLLNQGQWYLSTIMCSVPKQRRSASLSA